MFGSFGQGCAHSAVCRGTRHPCGAPVRVRERCRPWRIASTPSRSMLAARTDLGPQRRADVVVLGSTASIRTRRATVGHSPHSGPDRSLFGGDPGRSARLAVLLSAASCIRSWLAIYPLSKL